MPQKHNRGGKNHLRPTVYPFKEGHVPMKHPHRAKRIPKRGNRGSGKR